MRNLIYTGMTTDSVLTGDDLRADGTSPPEEAIAGMVDAAQFQQQERKLDAICFVRAMVIAAATGYGGRQRDVARLYYEQGAPRVAGWIYAWFGPQLEATMAGLSQRAIHHARAQQLLDVPPLMLKHARDWHIVDATTIKLPDELAGRIPRRRPVCSAQGPQAAVGGDWNHLPIPLQPGPGPRRSASGPWMRVGEVWDCFDLGLRESGSLSATARPTESRFVMRLRESWKPKVGMWRGASSRYVLSQDGLGCDAAAGVPLLDGRALDADVTLGRGNNKVVCRLCGVPAPDGTYRFCRPICRRDWGPHQVSDFYRVRWEIESDNKLDKSCNHLQEIKAQTGPGVRALIHASLISSMLACLVVHRHRLKEARRRIKPPSGPRRRCTPVGSAGRGSAARSLAKAFELSGESAQKVATPGPVSGRTWARTPTGAAAPPSWISSAAGASIRAAQVCAS